MLNPCSVCIYRMRSTRSDIYHSDLLLEAISLDLPQQFLSRSLIGYIAAIPAFLTAGTVRPVANASGLSAVFAPGSRPKGMCCPGAQLTSSYLHVQVSEQSGGIPSNYALSSGANGGSRTRPPCALRMDFFSDSWC